MSRSQVALYYHLLLGTKNREPHIPESIEPELYDYITSAVRKHRGSIVTIGGTSNHVHLLARLSQHESLKDVMRALKAGSSAWMHEAAGMKDFRWQNGYGAYTVGEKEIPRMERYIIGQKEHHRDDRVE